MQLSCLNLPPAAGFVQHSAQQHRASCRHATTGKSVAALPRQAAAALRARPVFGASCSRSRSTPLVVRASAVDASLANAPKFPLTQENGAATAFPPAAGVYAVYDESDTLQYVGISRKIALSVATHAKELPELTKSVRFSLVSNSSKEGLTEAWKNWVQDAVNESGAIPPGNMPGVKTWTTRKGAAPRAEIKLTPGKGLDDLTCGIEELIDQVVKTNKVVAFVKGTRTEPQCGFSYKVLSLLNELGTTYEVVNVLDEVYNPGLREAIKLYSQWPTIPQVYVDGEFVGGADIVEEMYNSGELQRMLKETAAKGSN